MVSPKTVALVIICALAFSAATGLRAAVAQPISRPAANAAASAGASGDSMSPLISGDGRYVFFSSEALDITDAATNSPNVAAVVGFNIYVRDRVAKTTSLVTWNGVGSAPSKGSSGANQLSADYHLLLFESTASDLVSGDVNSANDVFIRNIASGRTTLVSANTNGVPGNGESRSASMTPDGRYVVFVSTSTDLVANDTNGIADVFVRDTQTGTTVCASAGAARYQTGASSSEEPHITPDGRFVVFLSSAQGISPPATNASGYPGDVYVRDVVAGTTSLASVNARKVVNAGSTTQCYNDSISADGNLVTFSCGSYVLQYNRSTALTAVVATNGIAYAGGLTPNDARTMEVTPDGQFIAYVALSASNVFLANVQTTNVIALTTNKTGYFYSPQIDDTGRYVSYLSTAPVTSGIVSNDVNIFIYDSQAGTTALVNVDTNGIASRPGPVATPSLSTNAQFVAFESEDTTLVGNDINHSYDIFLRDVIAGTNELISVRAPSITAATANGAAYLTGFAISSNAQYVAFGSTADNLVPNDYNSNGYTRVFFRDITAATNAVAGFLTNGTASEPTISGNGRYVAFTARSTNDYDIHLWDSATGSSSRISTNMAGAGHSAASSASSGPQLSGDGRYCLFLSQATDLTAGMPAGTTNHYLSDMQAGTTVALTTNTNGRLSVAAMTSDGRYVALGFSDATGSPMVYDTSSNRFVFMGALANVVAIAINADGLRIACATTTNAVFVTDIASHSNRTAGFFYSPSVIHKGLKFSADGRYLVYATKASAVATNTDVYLYDYLSNTTTLISKGFGTLTSGGGTSDSPDITADGRYILYRSTSSNIVPGDTNGAPDIFLYDTALNSTMLLTTDQTGLAAANGRSVNPKFSADGRSLIFGSWAGNLAAADYNQTADLFLVGIGTGAFVDADGDGMDDAWEMKYFGTTLRDGTGDFDGDGVSDLDEFLAGTDPTDPTSLLRVQILGTGASVGGTLVSWPAVAGKNYRVEYKQALSDPSWTQVPQTTGVLGTRGYALDSASGVSQRFYRVSVVR